MSRIIHCADLHLSQKEKKYSLSVLQEIIDITIEKKADFLIFAGDTFDSFTDVESLRSDFRNILAVLSNSGRKINCTILLLPGNHEDLNRGARQISNLDFSGTNNKNAPVNIKVLTDTPFSLLTINNIEFLCIPHQKNYSSYLEWSVPPKKSNMRIAIAHGVISGLTYTGPEQETGGTVLDRNIFTRFHVDYAAMGHIHSGITQSQNNFTLAYPGSSRVWRKGETGARTINYIDFNIGHHIEKIPLQSAGQYRHYNIPLNLNGTLGEIPNEIINSWSDTDWIDLNLSGLVEDENTVAVLAEDLSFKFSKQVRKINISRDNITVLEGISSEPIAQSFIKLWKEKTPGPDSNSRVKQVWQKSREIALNKIKEIIEARK